MFLVKRFPPAARAVPGGEGKGGDEGDGGDDVPELVSSQPGKDQLLCGCAFVE